MARDGGQNDSPDKAAPRSLRLSIAVSAIAWLEHDAFKSNRSRRHMWTAPIGKSDFDVLIGLVGCGHMSGLCVRP
jgi:hypothetical protein